MGAIYNNIYLISRNEFPEIELTSNPVGGSNAHSYKCCPNRKFRVVYIEWFGRHFAVQRE